MANKSTKIPCYIFDIDGTLADNSHRAHHLLKAPKDWDAYHALAHLDTVFTHIKKMMAHLKNHAKVVFCTGRHDGQRGLTEEWIFTNCGMFAQEVLYMRKEGDHRPDHVIKLELLAQIRTDGYEPIMVFDDRNSVVQMWRDNGIPCAQVAIGDF
jgi:phosphoglycolate phosphatase-like HAD superfamily hydrolase